MIQKILALALLLSLSYLTLAAQDTTHTLLKLTKPHSWGIYVAPEAQYGQVKSAFTSFSGGSAMLMINNRFALGITAQQSLNRNFSPKGISPLFLQSAIGGLKMEYTPKPTAAVHVTFPLLIGGGFAQTDSLGENRAFNRFDGRDRDKGLNRNRGNGYAIIQPGINVEANLLSFMKLFVGANYRFSILSENNSALLTANTLQGVSVSAGAKVGIFDYHFKKHNKTMPVEN
jgi:hypothetical protein